MPRAPIDDAAVLILRPLLQKLERGEVVVTNLAAGDDEACSIALTWRPEAPSGGPPPAMVDRSDRCPGCDAQGILTSDGFICPDCQRTW